MLERQTGAAISVQAAVSKGVSHSGVQQWIGPQQGLKRKKSLWCAAVDRAAARWATAVWRHTRVSVPLCASEEVLRKQPLWHAGVGSTTCNPAESPALTSFLSSCILAKPCRRPSSRLPRERLALAPPAFCPGARFERKAQAASERVGVRTKPNAYTHTHTCHAHDSIAA